MSEILCRTQVAWVIRSIMMITSIIMLKKGNKKLLWSIGLWQKRLFPLLKMSRQWWNISNKPTRTSVVTSGKRRRCCLRISDFWSHTYLPSLAKSSFPMICISNGNNIPMSTGPTHQHSNWSMPSQKSSCPANNSPSRLMRSPFKSEQKTPQNWTNF